jgi:hypothetical protein
MKIIKLNLQNDWGSWKPKINVFQSLKFYRLMYNIFENNVPINESENIKKV